jgi:TetR/AcrR family transcriptional regulator, repressor for uid operon
VLRTEPESFLRTLTTDGASVVAVVRRSVADWLGSSGGGPLSDEDAEMVAARGSQRRRNWKRSCPVG